MALRRWILRRRILVSGGASFPEYEFIQAEISARVEKLLGDLETAATPTKAPDGGEIRVPGPDRLLDWPSLVLETEQTVADLCLLVALFSQKSEFRRALAESLDVDQNAPDKELAERRDAIALLQTGLERASLMTDRVPWGCWSSRAAAERSCLCGIGRLSLGRCPGRGEERVQLPLSGRDLHGQCDANLSFPLFFTLNYQQERKKAYAWECVRRERQSRRSARN